MWLAKIWNLRFFMKLFADTVSYKISYNVITLFFNKRLYCPRDIKKGNHLFDISWAIQSFVEEKGYNVVRDFVGHGIGKELHEEPQIPNFGKPHTGPLLREGMVLAIEPMVNQGTWEVKVLDDRWTVVTLDGSLSCHFE